MMIHGVFERFPRLRVAFLEAGCGWVPYLMHRLQEGWEHRLDRWPYQASRSPKEIMRGGNPFYSCEIGEETLPTVAELMGRTQLLWPSDSRHEKPWTNSAVISIHSLDAMICPKRRPARFYGRTHAGCMDCPGKNFLPMPCPSKNKQPLRAPRVIPTLH